MKTRNAANYAIAISVILCSLLLCSTLVFALTGFRLHQPARTIDIDFRHVTGIGPGTAVLYAGSPAGNVISLRHLTLDERRQSGDPTYVVRVTAAIEDGVPALTADIRSGIATDSFLGDKFIALLPGSVDAPPLPEGVPLRSTEAGLMELVQRVGSNLDDLISRLGRDYDQLVPQLTELLRRTGGMVDASTNLVANLNTTALHAQDLVRQVNFDYQSSYNPAVEALLRQLQRVGTNVDLAVQNVNTNATQTLQEARSLVEANRDNLTTLIAELRVVSQNLKVISTYTKALTGRLGEKPSRLIWSKSQPLPSEQDIIESPEPIAVPLQKDPK